MKKKNKSVKITSWLPLHKVMDRWGVFTLLEMTEHLKNGLQPYNEDGTPLELPMYACEYFYIMENLADLGNVGPSDSRRAELEESLSEFTGANDDGAKPGEGLKNWRHYHQPDNNKKCECWLSEQMPDNPMEELKQLLEKSCYKMEDVTAYEKEFGRPNPKIALSNQPQTQHNPLQWNREKRGLFYLFIQLMDRGDIVRLDNSKLAEFISSNFVDRDGRLLDKNSAERELSKLRNNEVPPPKMSESIDKMLNKNLEKFPNK